MIHKLLAFCAALALACSPAYAAGWYPGFTGTGQVAPGTGGTAPAVTSGTFYGDSSYASAAPAFDWRWLVAYNQSYATQSANAAAAGTGSLAYAMMYVCGSGGTGNAPLTTCSAIYANATTGLPDPTTAVVVASATSANIGTKQSAVPGAGTAANNPMFGGDGTATAFAFEENLQLAGTVPSSPGSPSNGTSRPTYWETCSNDTLVPNSFSTPCFGFSVPGQQQNITLSNPPAQPYTLFSAWEQKSAGKYYYQTFNGGTTPGLYGSATTNQTIVTAGTIYNATATNAAIHAYNVAVNGASSLVQVDAATNVATNLGTTALTGAYTIGVDTNTISFGNSIHTGSLTATQQLAANKLMSTTFGFGF